MAHFYAVIFTHFLPTFETLTRFQQNRWALTKGTSLRKVGVDKESNQPQRRCPYGNRA